MSTGNPAIIVRLTPSQKQIVSGAAKAQGVTMSEYVRMAISAYLLKTNNA